MRTFKIKGSHGSFKLKGKGGRKRKKQILAEGAMKARLKRSGLWDASAARKSTLVVTRIEKPVPADPKP